MELIINTILHLRRIIKIAINNGLVRNDPFVGYKYIAEDGVRWIHLNRKKTGAPYHIPLLEIPLQLIEKHKGIAEENKLFPMISCCKTNIYLKRIATECNINKRITFHMARHCYASVVTLLMGVQLETVGESLGHTDWRATRIYAQVSNEKIGDDMQLLNKRLSGRYDFEKANSIDVVF